MPSVVVRSIVWNEMKGQRNRWVRKEVRTGWLDFVNWNYMSRTGSRLNRTPSARGKLCS